jgi:hypothetical protein
MIVRGCVVGDVPGGYFGSAADGFPKGTYEKIFIWNDDQKTEQIEQG